MSAEPAGSIGTGPGRTLTALYALFALAATGRSVVQLGTAAGRAPLAYGLSAAAGALYLVAAGSLLAGNRARPVAVAVCAVELAGVLLVGAVSYARPDLFPDRTVWSHFGQGYGYLPAALPVLGLCWLISAGRQPCRRRRTP